MSTNTAQPRGQAAASRHNLGRQIRLLLGLLFLILGAAPPLARSEPLVFAHYMLYSFLYSDDVAGMKREIQLAQQHGIDAFALNTGVWDDEYQTRADHLYQAAASLGFKIFFSADMQGSLTVANIVTMLTRYASYSSQLTYNGKQFFSTFTGRSVTLSPYSSPLSTWQDGIFPAAGGRDQIFFVPFFETSGQQDDISYVLSTFASILDGLFAWDTSAWPYLNSDYNTVSTAADQAYIAACSAAGKVYMPSVSPWFFRSDLGVKGNYAGDTLWRTKWGQLAAMQPLFVEIISWNDWAERHYVVSVPSDNTPYGSSENNDQGFPHLPYLDLAGRYYIPWLKSGNAPAIAQDVLYLFYYTQTKSGSSIPNVAAALVDNVYATVLLTQAGDVQLTSGSATTTFSGLQPGVNSVSMPFNVGQQTATLSRNGATVLTITGADAITAPTSPQDFNVYTAQAS